MVFSEWNKDIAKHKRRTALFIAKVVVKKVVAKKGSILLQLEQIGKVDQANLPVEKSQYSLCISKTYRNSTLHFRNLGKNH